MRKPRVFGVAALCALFLIAADNPPAEDRLWEHRNLGKAFYENPDTHVQAVTELHEALLLAPDSSATASIMDSRCCAPGRTRPEWPNF